MENKLVLHCAGCQEDEGLIIYPIRAVSGGEMIGMVYMCEECMKTLARDRKQMNIEVNFVKVN